MYHSITYGEKNTWDDWHLLPSTRPLFNPPPTKTKQVDIPGANGSIDLTESLTGYPVYENRTGSTEFYVANGYQDWNVLYSEIMGYLHGKEMKAYLEDDPYFYYVGRFEVNQWKSDKYWSIITIDYDVYPYKKEPYESGEDWLWDPFPFEYGIARDYGGFEIDKERTITIVGRQEPVMPFFVATVTSGDNIKMTTDRNDKTYSLSNRSYMAFPELIISTEPIEFTFKGYGTVEIQYQGGML